LADRRVEVFLDPDGDGPAPELSDAVRFTVDKFALAIDSDNTGAIDHTVYEDFIKDRDYIMTPEGQKAILGKMLTLADGDADGDGIPDFADGFNRDAENADDDFSTHAITNVELTVPLGTDPSKAYIRFDYDASDPGGVTCVDGVYELPENGSLRLWKTEGNGNPSEGTGNPQPLLPSRTFIGKGAYRASELGFSDTVRTVTFWLEAVKPSLEAKRISAFFYPNGLTVPVAPAMRRFAQGPACQAAPAQPQAATAAQATASQVKLETSNRTSVGTPLLLNDDWDCERKYGEANYPANDLRYEKEPVWDLENTLPVAKEDDDLMEVKILAPVGLQGTVRLKISNPHSSIRLWTTRKKDALVNIPNGGKEYEIADLSQNGKFFVEGIALGRAVITLEYDGDATGIINDKINIDVVNLYESQIDDDLRHVIYDYNADIKFEVKLGPGTLLRTSIFGILTEMKHLMTELGK
jgi:hypothetical protein